MCQERNGVVPDKYSQERWMGRWKKHERYVVEGENFMFDATGNDIFIRKYSKMSDEYVRFVLLTYIHVWRL